MKPNVYPMALIIIGKISKGIGIFSCICGTGFGGRNCSINLDDCHNHKCQNDALCLDGVNEYTCKCPLGFSGKYCQLQETHLDLPATESSKNPAYFLKRAADESSRHCSHNNCKNGWCQSKNAFDDDDFDSPNNNGQCHCLHGFGGFRCASQISVSFNESDSYLALPSWNGNPKRNLTLTLRTLNKTGVIAYYGDNSYIGLELFDGRIKAIFYIGNYPSSHMYSYSMVNDGMPHRLEIIIDGKQLSLTVDDAKPQSVNNTGKFEHFHLNSKQNLYLGGLPNDIAKKTYLEFHLKNTQRCISNVYMNNELKDLGDPTFNSHSTLAGCAATVDLCQNVNCGGEIRGKCQVNTTLADGFQCECNSGFSGKNCEKKSLQCIKEKIHDFYVEGECRSTERIKTARCTGTCGTITKLKKPDRTQTFKRSITESRNQDPEDEGCCASLRTKRRRVKMHCRDGGTKVTLVQIIRKCACKNECGIGA